MNLIYRIFLPKLIDIYSKNLFYFKDINKKKFIYLSRQKISKSYLPVGIFIFIYLLIFWFFHLLLINIFFFKKTSKINLFFKIPFIKIIGQPINRILRFIYLSIKYDWNLFYLAQFFLKFLEIILAIAMTVPWGFRQVELGSTLESARYRLSELNALP